MDKSEGRGIWGWEHRDLGFGILGSELGVKDLGRRLQGMSRAKSELLPIQSALPAVVAELLKLGPMSSEKIEFAWKAAVGGPLARVSTARLGPQHTLEVTAGDERWARELRRSASTIVPRLNALLGSDVVTHIAVISELSNSGSRFTNPSGTPNPESRAPNPVKLP